MRSLTTLIGMDALTLIHATPTSGARRLPSGSTTSRRKAWGLLRARTARGSQNIVRNDSPPGLSWLISCLRRGVLALPLAFLQLIVLSLWYGRVCILLKDIDVHHSLGSWYAIRASEAFFMATPFPSVLGLSRLPKKGRNFNPRIVIGSGKATLCQFVAGVWGVCGIALLYFIDTL